MRSLPAPVRRLPRSLLGPVRERRHHDEARVRNRGPGRLRSLEGLKPVVEANRSNVIGSVLITGSAGFIAGWLKRQLREDGSVTRISTIDLEPDHETDGHVQMDIAAGDFVETASALGGHDVIIHLAAAHRDDIRPVSRYDEVNVLGTRHICELARKTGVNKLVFASSVAVYGYAPPDTGIDGAITPFNDYGRTKALAEDVLLEWYREAPDQRTLVIVRPTVVFGPGNRGNVYNLLRQISSGIFVMIGDGENRKSMAYVGNIARFFKSVTRLQGGLHVFNYVDKPDYNMRDLVGDTREVLGRSRNGYVTVPLAVGKLLGRIGDFGAMLLKRPLPVTSIRVEKFCATTQFATNMADIGFVPETPLKTALVETIRQEFVASGK